MEAETRSENRGAAAVEFAIILPLLLTVLFGIIEFGAAYSQMLDVRHGAREAPRLVAVNDFPPGEDATTTTAAEQTAYLVETICNRMDFAGDVSVTIELEDPLLDGAGAAAIVAVAADLNTLTGWFDPILGGKRIESEVEVRLEQQAQWAVATDTPCPEEP